MMLSDIGANDGTLLKYFKKVVLKPLDVSQQKILQKN